MLTGQEDAPQLNANFITEEIIIDGALSEHAWASADSTEYFQQYFPSDTTRAIFPTFVKVLYDERNLYISFRAESENDDFVVSTLRRDFRGTTNDNVSLIFDTFSDGINAFFFGVTPFGVRREGLIFNGGQGFDNTWDVKWRAESQRYGNHYTIEIAIPFTSLKFKEGSTSWRFRPYRWNIQSMEQSTWVGVPQNQIFSSLAFMGNLNFERPLGKSRTPLTFIPYVNALTQSDKIRNISEQDFSIGGDAKIAVGNSMNLDLTLNPDFSNVEVDDIFTNLTRFELLLPEKRQFFIDNIDLFASFGNTFNEARPFFSRRIGLARNQNGELIQNRIIGGARLSGKLDQDWRLGFLNMQTADDPSNEIASYNNMMVALQRRVAQRSNIGFFLVNRESFEEYDFLNDAEKYNRVIGVDYNLASANNTWTGKFYLHKSFQPDDQSGNISSQATITYNTRKWTYIQDWVYIDQDFRADLGFVPRTDILKSGNGLTRKFFPQSGSLSNHSFRLLSIIYWQPSQSLKKTDHFFRLTWQALFKNQTTFEAELSNDFIYLRFPFDPTRSGVEPLPANRGYSFNQFGISYNSNNTQLLTFGLDYEMGEFFNGNIVSAGADLGYRIQPFAQFSLGINYDGIRLPDPHGDADYWLTTFRSDLTFSKSLFWSSIIQYSNQRKNIGINSRLQWRFAPLSDLFLVYNDNYLSTDFTSKFRSLNLKLTYWLNI